jgi:hypothetical protein
MANADWALLPQLRYEEGWGVYDTDLGPQVQTADEDGPEVFETDQDAMRFIRARAAAGSGYHAAVLRWLKLNAPDEYEHLMTLEMEAEQPELIDEAA